MGNLFDCIKPKTKSILDERISLRSNARIKVKRNENEDPNAPLLSKDSKNFFEEPLNIQIELKDEEIISDSNDNNN